MMKRIKSYSFSVLLLIFAVFYSCDDELANVKVDKRMLGIDSIAIVHPNPITGLEYTIEELGSIDYNPFEEEYYSEGQAINLTIKMLAKPDFIDVISVKNRKQIATITESKFEAGFYVSTYTTNVSDLGLEIKDNLTLLFNVTYRDKNQDGFDYPSLGSISFKITRVKAFDPNSSLSDGLVGYWRFNDSSKPLNATKGKNLVLNGAASHTSITGVNSEDGAVLADVGTWYDVFHNMQASGGERINEYTMIWDVKVAAADLGKYLCLLQSNTANDSDGAFYIHPNGGFWFNGGPGGHAEGTIKADTWHRLVLSVSAPEVILYVDGNEIYKDEIAEADGKFSLDPLKFLILGENSSNNGNGEDNPIAISEFMLFNNAFSGSQIKNLKPIGEPAVDDFSSSLNGRWKFNDNESLLKAHLGNDLVLNGAETHLYADGVNNDDGAAFVEAGTWYDVTHSMPASGGDRVNEFSMIWDVKVAASDLGKYICLLQHNIDNDTDGAFYIHPNGGFWFNGGPGGHAEGTIKADTWHRLILSVSAPEVTLFVDGNEIYKGEIAELDGKFSLDSSKFIILGENSSNNGNAEDNPITISDFMVFNRALISSEISKIPLIGTSAL